MKKILLKLKTKIYKNFKDAKMSKYIGNIVYLLIFVLVLQICDYITLDTSLTFLETVLSGLLLFVFLTVIYSIFSPTLWGLIFKKQKRITKQ